MSILTESQLRDMLARNLSVIEPGLRLIQPEFWLKNVDNVKGSIDLLAQDRHRLYVVIEVKVSEPSGRKAPAQVMKYVRLLQENGIPRKRIRVIIVSTTWGELLSTISEFAKSQEYDVRGYEVDFDEDGALIVKPVQLLSDALEQRLTPIHFQYFYCCIEDREIGWRQIVQSVREIGADHIVGVDLDFSGTEGIVGPYSLYVAFGTIAPGGPTDGPGGPAEEDYREDQIYDRHRREYRALCHMTSTVFAPLPCSIWPDNKFWGTSEPARPEKFVAFERHPQWEVRQVRGTGAYAPEGLWNERDIRAALAGEDGEPGPHVMASASTKVESTWNALRETIRASLAGNDEWLLQVNHILDQLVQDERELNVVLSVDNPGDLIQTLIAGYPDKISEYAPKVYGLAGEDGGFAFEIVGQLRWTGRYVPNIVETTRKVYPFPESWMLVDGDRDLLDRLGLHYTTHISIVAPEAPARVVDDYKIFITHNGKLKAVVTRLDLVACDWADYLTLDDFVHAHRGEIHALVHEYRNFTG